MLKKILHANVDTLLKFFIFISVISIFVGIYVLLFGIPFNGNEIKRMGSFSDMSMAITSIFLVILAISGLLFVVGVEKAEFKAKERLSEDLISLQMNIKHTNFKSQLCLLPQSESKNLQCDFQEKIQFFKEFQTSSSFAVTFPLN